MGINNFINKTKYEEEILSEGMIANAKLLSNDKYEFDNILFLFGDRLKITPNGDSRIGRKIKVKGFNDKYIYRVFLWPIKYKSFKEDLRESTYELSSIITSLFSYSTNEKDYIGLEQVFNNKDRSFSVGKGLNNLVNSAYSLMSLYSKYNMEQVTPNDIMYKDMRINMQNDLTLYDVDLYAFNLARLLLVVSDNFPQINYTRLINNKKSPVTTRRYNESGEYVVLNDLLYAGKYGKAACQYEKIFDSYTYPNAFEILLKEYDEVLDCTKKGQSINKNIIKDMVKTIYLYYGSKFLKMRDSNAFDYYGLELYKTKVKNAFNSVLNQYDIVLDYNDFKYKEHYEKSVELSHKENKSYYKLSRVKESFEPHEKVPVDANNKAREIKLKYNLKG